MVTPICDKNRDFVGWIHVTSIINCGKLNMLSKRSFLLFAPPTNMNDTYSNMGLDTTKPVFGVSDKARLKPVASATETS